MWPRDLEFFGENVIEKAGLRRLVRVNPGIVSATAMGMIQFVIPSVCRVRQEQRNVVDDGVSRRAALAVEAFQPASQWRPADRAMKSRLEARHVARTGRESALRVRLRR